MLPLLTLYGLGNRKPGDLRAAVRPALVLSNLSVMLIKGIA